VVVVGLNLRYEGSYITLSLYRAQGEGDRGVFCDAAVPISSSGPVEICFLVILMTDEAVTRRNHLIFSCLPVEVERHLGLDWTDVR
jgi:hypothetical protein